MTHLPNELLQLIVNSFTVPYAKTTKDLPEYRAAQRTLWSLCLVSSQLRAIAQPRLYRTFVKYGTSPKFELTDQGQASQERCRQSNAKTRKQLASFIHTLIERPDLAAQVECLRIESFRDEEEEEEPTDSSDGSNDGENDMEGLPLDPGLADLFVAAIMRIPDPAPTKVGLQGITQWAEWEVYLKEGSEGAQVALLLSLVPGLHYLHIEPNGEDLGLLQDLCDKLLGSESLEKHDVLRRSNSGPSNFSSQLMGSRPILNQLQHLTVKSPSPESERVLLEHCVNLLTLPTLESFAGYGLKDEHSFDNDEEFYRLPLGHLHGLKLDNCFVAVASIGALVESCTSLRSLKVAFPGPEPDGDDRHYEAELSDEFVDLLATFSSSLEHLSLIFPQGWSSITTATPFDIRSLNKLRVLDVDVVVPSLENDPPQLSLDKLPRNLEVFSIHDCREGVLFFVNELIAASGEFGLLKIVGLGVADEENETLQDAIRDLTVKARAVGIELKTWVGLKPLGHVQSLPDGNLHSHG